MSRNLREVTTRSPGRLYVAVYTVRIRPINSYGTGSVPVCRHGHISSTAVLYGDTALILVILLQSMTTFSLVFGWKTKYY